MEKRILSIVLALVLCIGLLPTMAFANDYTVLPASPYPVGIIPDQPLELSREISGGTDSSAVSLTSDIPAATVPDSDSSNVKVEASVSGSTATVKPIQDTELDKVIDDAYVEIDLSNLNETVDSVKLPTETVKKIADDKDGLSIKFSDSAVAFDKSAMQEIASQASGSTVELVVRSVAVSALNTAQQEALKKLDIELVFDAQLLSDGKQLCTEALGGFGSGMAILSLPFALKPNYSGTGYKVYCVDASGAAKDMEAHYSRWNKSFEFVSEYFSSCAIAYVENAYAACPKDATCPMTAFSDLNVSAWYHDGVHYCLDNALMSGVGDAKFDPAGSITRAMIVMMLWRLEGQPYLDYFMQFTDVPASQWYTEAIRWASAEKIAGGYPDNTFRPNDPVTREQLSTILYNYAKHKGQGFVGSWMFLLDFVDRASISSWADEAVHWCSMKGVVTGKDGKVFDPQGYATRAEAAAMMQRFCGALKAE